MFTLAAFDEIRAAVTVLEPLDAVDDDHITAVGNDLIVPKFNNLAGMYAGHGVTAVAGSGSQAYIDSPSLRRMTRHEIAAIDNFENVPPPGLPQMFQKNPIPLDEGEALNAYLANTAVAANGRGMPGVWFSDGPIAPIDGEIRTILATSVVAGDLGEWSSGPLTLAYDLPVGRYQLVGARCLAGATSGLFRFIFVDMWQRPGGVSVRHINDDDLSAFRNGIMGVWGEFGHRALPRLEVLNIETVANPDVYLDVIKVS